MPSPDAIPTEVADSVRADLLAGLAALDLSRDEHEPLANRLLDYLTLLVRWNGAYNLTAVRDPLQMVSRHLFDSLAIAAHVHGTLADVGSGAGLPGIPLALARPDLKLTLIESNGKKARFLREAVRVLQLPNVQVAHQRAQAHASNHFDQVVSRAFSSLADFVRASGHLLKPGGQLLAMKGLLPADEIAALPQDWSVVARHRLQVPGMDAERHLLVLEAVAA
ncbi:MAG: 16S rRNA (guanine(527)-N(7))-methyltransferase RsmG [Lysobacteraceae bacterium]